MSLNTMSYFSMIKHNNQTQLAEEKIIWLKPPHNFSSSKKVRTGAQERQDPKGMSRSC